MKEKELALDSMLGEKVQRMFNREVAEVIADLDDASKKPEATRSVTLHFTFATNGSRQAVFYDCKATHKLAPASKVKGTAWLTGQVGTHARRLMEVEDEQMNIPGVAVGDFGNKGEDS
ncbi:MAG: hypothetical protein AAGN66_07005 [Acidobacteriota bacterium]